MNYLRKKYLESMAPAPKLPFDTDYLKPIKTKKTPKPTLMQKWEKHNGLDKELNLNTSKAGKEKRNYGKPIMKPKKRSIIKKKKVREDVSDALHMRTVDELTAKKENAVLHLKYKGDMAALVCQVRTANLGALKMRLSKVLQQYKSRFRPVNSPASMFTQMGLIHTIMTSQAIGDFADLTKQLQRDALQCNAIDCKIVSIEMGALCFRCNSVDISEVSAKLKLAGYKPLLSEVGYCAKEPLVSLTLPQMQRYSEFIKALEADADVVKVYDNVHNSMLYSMYTS